MHLNKLVNLKFCFLCEEAAEPVKGKKRKGKSSRPLRIDLILQHDSLVAPPKESVILVSLILESVVFQQYFLPLLSGTVVKSRQVWECQGRHTAKGLGTKVWAYSPTH